jgi:hypothetical protein
VSNIVTDFVRVYADARHRIDPTEAEWLTWQLLGPRGSYWVPVWFSVAPDGGHVDIQYGSGKSAGIVDFCDGRVGQWPYRLIWGRRFDAGGDEDVIWRDHVSDGPHGYCRYGFDQVRVETVTGDRPAVGSRWRREADGSWVSPVDGDYRTGNDRFAEIGPGATPSTVPARVDPAALTTPTTPNQDGRPLVVVDPPWLASLAPLLDGPPGRSEQAPCTLVELFWRGRPVHRVLRSEAEWTGWRHQCADDWDNCLDADFLRCTGATDRLLDDAFYERDRQDWLRDRR